MILESIPGPYNELNTNAADAKKVSKEEVQLLLTSIGPITAKSVEKKDCEKCVGSITVIPSALFYRLHYCDSVGSINSQIMRTSEQGFLISEGWVICGWR